jgi:quinol monooxygenase YgiN
MAGTVATLAFPPLSTGAGRAYGQIVGEQPAGLPTRRHPMVEVALVVKLTAKAGMEAELAEFLTGALSLANDEAGTEVWMALRSDQSTFWIVDAFPGDAERKAHLEGPIAEALFANADRLLDAAPEVHPADVLAIK